ncbi:Tar ligand binding domain-containing protein, partial [Halomonas sp. BBD48]|nr:Tar ligand binding domain-containing protein [Halomonas sp. BBD48]
MVNRLRNLSVKASLTLVLAVFTVFLLMTAWLGHSASNNGEKALEELHQINVLQLNAINLTRAHLSDVQLNFERFVDATGQGENERASAYLAESQAAMQRAETRFAQYRDAPKTERGKPFADATGAAYSHLVNELLKPQLQALNGNDLDAFRALQDEAMAATQEFKRVSQEFIDYADARGDALITDFNAQVERFEIFEIVVLLLTVALVVLVRVGMV